MNNDQLRGWIRLAEARVREKGIVYISANNNMDYWGGYFPGFARDRFKRVPAVVTIVDPVEDDDTQYGIVKIRNVTLRVRRFDPGNDWDIVEELG